VRGFQGELLKRQAQQTEREFGAMGASEGAAGRFKRREGSTVADNAFNKANEAAFKASLSTNMRNGMAEAADAHRDDVAGFSNAVGYSADGPTGKGALAGWLDGLPPDLRVQAEAEAATRFQTHVRDISKRQRANAEAEARGALNTEIKGKIEDAKSAAFIGGNEGVEAIQKLFGTDEEPGALPLILREGVDAGAITPLQESNILLSARQSVAEEGLRGAFDRSPDKQGTLDAFEKENPKDLGITTEQFRTLKGSFQTAITFERVAADREQQKIDRAIKAELATNKKILDRLTEEVLAGVPLDEEAQAEVQEFLAGNRAVDPEEVEDLVIAVDGMEVTNKLKAEPLARMEAFVNEFTKDPPTSLREAKQQQAARRVYASHNSGLTGPDPIAYVRSIGVATAPPMQFDSVGSILAGLPNSHASQIEAEDTYNQEFSPLTKAEAAGLSAFLDEATPEDVAGVLLGINATFGPEDSAPLYAQIAEKGQQAYAVAGAVAESGDLGIASEIVEGYQRLIANPKLKPTGIDVDATFDAVFGEALSNLQVGVRPQYIAAATALYVKRNAGDISGEVNTDVLLRAAVDLVGQPMEFQASTFGPTSSTVAPPGVEPSEFASRFRRVTADDLANMGGVRGLGVTIGLDQIQEFAELDNAGFDRYLVRVGAIQLQTDDGEPFVYEHSKASGLVDTQISAEREARDLTRAGQLGGGRFALDEFVDDIPGQLGKVKDFFVAAGQQIERGLENTAGEVEKQALRNLAETQKIGLRRLGKGDDTE